MAETIDCYAHYLPRAFVEATYARHPTDTLAGLRSAEHFWDVDRRLDDLDDHGIDRQVICLTQHNWPNLDPDEALEVARVGNDGIHDVAAAHPDRFVPVATLPYPTNGFLEEFDRCVDDLGMAGVQLFTNVRDRPIDGNDFDPFYEAAARKDVPIWLHPQTNAWRSITGEYALTKMFGWPFDTTLALARLAFGGVLERYPDLDVVTHHNGGMIPFFAERASAYYRKETAVDWADLGEPPAHYFRRLHADAMVNGSVPALECGVSFYGADRVVVGTDYPFGPEAGREYLRVTLEAVDALDIAPGDHARIRGENAARLLA